MNTAVLPHNHGQIYYWADGSGDPMVFIHGNLLDHTMWQRQVTHFSKTNQVITYDVRGFGKSSAPTHQFSDEDDLKALLNHLSVRQAHIVGLSMGGKIAINLTLKNPHLVKSLTLLDPSLDGFKSTKSFLGRLRLLCKLKATERKAFARRSLGRRRHRSTFAAATDRLSQITVPTLVIVGDDDLPYFKAIATKLNDTIKNSRLVAIPRAGHLVNVDAPAKTNKLLADFIAHV